MDPTDDKSLVPEGLRHSKRPIPLGGSELGPRRHICGFFNSYDDEYRVLLPFIKDGLECGDSGIMTDGLDIFERSNDRRCQFGSVS
jgi:hypothetical protein